MDNNEIILKNKNDFPEFENIRKTILEAREKVATTINFAMVAAYWTIGKQIHDTTDSAGSVYGKQLLKFASEKLTEEFGQGFDERNLRYMRQFYETYPIWNTVCSELSWSHYRLLMRIKEQDKRAYYQKECVECAWSVRQLERQINSFYYERILATGEAKRAEVKDEIQVLEPDTDPKYILKCFVVVELKTHKLTYQDVGQLDFYVRYFEENIKTEGDNPTLGLILCSEKNESMVKYSVLNENQQLFASKYKLYIPTEEELKAELERERFNIEQRLCDKE